MSLPMPPPASFVVAFPLSRFREALPSSYSRQCVSGSLRHAVHLWYACVLDVGERYGYLNRANPGTLRRPPVPSLPFLHQLTKLIVKFLCTTYTRPMFLSHPPVWTLVFMGCSNMHLWIRKQFTKPVKDGLSFHLPYAFNDFAMQVIPNP